uniref:Uncharacterized protein n=1 Tax=Moniliophthora roreri TaxID=221103 RepID=A0A0W0FK74_MONRR
MYFTSICHISHISHSLRPKPRSIVEFSTASNDSSHCCLSFNLLTAVDSLTPVLPHTAPAVVVFLVGLLIGSFFWISAGIGYWVMAKKGAVDAELQEKEYEFPAPRKEGREPVKHQLWTLKLTGAGGLKKLCQTYCLSTSLGIDAFWSKLIEFSENPEKWDWNKADCLPEECPKYYKPRVPQGSDQRDADIESEKRFSVSDLHAAIKKEFSGLIMVQVWDNSLASFVAEECSVIIQGHRIAYKYWDQVFSHKGEGHDPSDWRWGKIGKLYNVWKHVADYYLPRTDEEFWAEFTDDKGEHMSFTAISKVLAAHCKAVQAS